MTRTQRSLGVWCYGVAWCFLLGLSFLIMSSGCGPTVIVTIQEELPIRLDINKIFAEQKVVVGKLFPGSRVPRSLKMSVPFWLTKKYDIRNNSKFKQYKSQISQLQIKRLSYRVAHNTLNIDIPTQGTTLDVFIGEIGAKSKDKYDKVGFLQPIPGGKVGVVDQLEFIQGGEEMTNTRFQKFAFEMGVGGSLLIDGTVSSVVPQGQLELIVEVQVSFGIDVL